MDADDLTRSVWSVDAADFPSTAPIDEQARFLLRYAILAPSSHNSQPWRFRVDGDAVRVGGDDSRWLDVADPDRRELFLSVGCAVENLRVAARAFGFDPDTDYHEDATDEWVATVALGERAVDPNAEPPAVFEALTDRRTSHDLFDGRPLSEPSRDRLVAAAADPDVTLHLVDDPERRRALGELQAEADRRQMANPDYRRELGHWVGSGALGSSWLVARLGQVAVTHLDLGDREAAKNSKLVASAPVVAVLETPEDDRVARVVTGEVFERVALRASAESVAVHPMSQILERPEMRRRLEDRLGLSERVQHFFRLGYADGRTEHTPRWPVERFVDG